MIKPKGKVIRNNSPRLAYASIGEPQFEIIAWCSDLEAKLPPSQVHFLVHWPEQLSILPPMAIRFQEPDTLGFFIEELIQYRRIVWPNSEPITGEQEAAHAA